MPSWLVLFYEQVARRTTVEETLIGNTLEETAYHEAGHILMAAVGGLDLKPKGIVIYEVAKDKTDGWAFYWEDQPLWDSILMAVRAGQIAQLRQFPNSEFRGGQYDVQRFFAVVKDQYGDRPAGEIWERISVKVIDLLIQHWAAVREIAESLVYSDWMSVDAGEHPIAKRKKVLHGLALVAILERHGIPARVRN